MKYVVHLQTSAPRSNRPNNMQTNSKRFMKNFLWNVCVWKLRESWIILSSWHVNYPTGCIQNMIIYLWVYQIYIETKMHQVLSDKILCHCLSNASRSIRRSAKIYCHVGRTETHVSIFRVRFAPTKEGNISLETPCNWTWQLSIEKEFSSSEKNVLREKEKEYSREDKKKCRSKRRKYKVSAKSYILELKWFWKEKNVQMPSRTPWACYGHIFS